MTREDAMALAWEIARYSNFWHIRVHSFRGKFFVLATFVQTVQRFHTRQPWQQFLQSGDPRLVKQRSEAEMALIRINAQPYPGTSS